MSGEHQDTRILSRQLARELNEVELRSVGGAYSADCQLTPIEIATSSGPGGDTEKGWQCDQ
jgi:hypothetical protein